MDKNNMFEEVKDAVPIVSYGAEVILKENKQRTIMSKLSFLTIFIVLVLAICCGKLWHSGRTDLFIFGVVAYATFVFRSWIYDDYITAHDSAFAALVSTNTRLGLFKEFKKDWLIGTINNLSNAYNRMIYKTLVLYGSLISVFVYRIFTQKEWIISSSIPFNISLICSIYMLVNIHMMTKYTCGFKSSIHTYNTKLNDFLDKYPNGETDVE